MPDTPLALERARAEAELLLVPGFDLRADQKNPPKLTKQKHQLAKGQVVARDPRTITGVVLHQTACVYGAKKPSLDAARRALQVAAHGVAFRAGFYALGNPLDWYVWHANRLNATTLGLEIEGFYSGLCDDPETVPREDLETTWGGKPLELTEATVLAARACLKRLVEEGRKLGCPIEWVYAHRQSSGTRRSDPGEAIWKRVVVEYAVPVLGLKTKPAFTVEAGKPIPRQWQAGSDAAY